MSLRLTLIAAALLLATSAQAWEYQRIVGGAVEYAEQTPPADADLSFPEDGQPALMIEADQEPEGRLISEEELQRTLSQPHLVIMVKNRNAPSNQVIRLGNQDGRPALGSAGR